MIYKYNEFLLEKEFNQIINDLFIIIESEKWLNDRTYEWDFTDNNKKTDSKSGKWTSDTTYEWDFTNDKTYIRLKKFLSSLSKEKVRDYFYDFVEKVKKLPNADKIIAKYSAVFLIFVSLGFLSKTPEGKKPLTTEIEQILTKKEKNEIKTSTFEEAQKFVKTAEGGYTDDKNDKGNFINKNGKKILIGTNHGISAPVLQEWLGRTPTKQDMIDLTYEEALEIYKKNYWDSQNLSEYQNQSLATLIYDGCVNQGIPTLKNMIKKAAINQNLDINNPFNINDIEELNKLDQELLFYDIKELREEKYKKGSKKYIKGWLNRLNSLIYE
jgi:hypothetical protein